MLTDQSLILPLSSELPIRDAAKSAILDDYEKLELIYPDIEARISQVKGLMSELFVHKRRKSK